VRSTRLDGPGWERPRLLDPSGFFLTIEHMFVEDQVGASAAGGSAEPRRRDASATSDVLLDHLEREIVELAAHINAGTCRWLELIAEFDRREGWGSWSCRSCAEWLAWRCALDTRTAREHVRVARAICGLPRIHAAFASGDLSYSKVRALTRVADAGSEADLIELAEHATASQLERVVRGLRRVSSQEADEIQRLRYLSTWWEADGSLSISANLPAEEGAAFLNALDSMHDLLRGGGASAVAPAAHPGAAAGAAHPGAGRDRDDGPAEPASAAASCGSAEPLEPRAATNADALTALAEAAVSAVSAASGGSPERPGGERYELVVHVDAATLAQRCSDPSVDAAARPGSARIEDGSALAPETIRRLACDCSIVALFEAADGSTLDVGRRRRSVPAAMARALRERDATCAYPGCESRRFLDAHHITHWAHGGKTSVENLVRLCRRHHRSVHEGGCSVERGRDGEIRFRDRHGLLSGSPSPPRGDPAVLAARDPSVPWPGSGERMDLDLTLTALLSRRRAALRPT